MSEEMLAPDAVTARVDRARAELLLARDATDAKRVADMARAAEVYARRQKLGREAIAYATAIVIDAMTVMGEFLKAAEKATGGQPYKGISTGSKSEPVEIPTLAEMGITKKESMVSQRLVEVREKLPSLYEQIRAGGVPVSKAVAAVRRYDVSQAVVRPTDDDPCCTVDDLRKLVARGDRFGTIYADPPWQYGNQATRAATDNHYQTMTLDDIAALPVGELAAEKAHLHLWTTDSFLEPAIELLKGWGFERRQTFVWVGVEVKTERTWTGNFYAETYSNAQPGVHERQGWLVTLRADWVVNVFLDVAVAVVMPLPQLRAWCIDQKNAFRYPARNPHQEQRNLTLGHLVPYAELAQVGAVCPRFYLCGEDGRWVEGSFADVLIRKQAVRLVA